MTTTATTPTTTTAAAAAAASPMTARHRMRPTADTHRKPSRVGAGVGDPPTAPREIDWGLLDGVREALMMYFPSSFRYIDFPTYFVLIHHLRMKMVDLV